MEPCCSSDAERFVRGMAARCRPFSQQAAALNLTTATVRMPSPPPAIPCWPDIQFVVQPYSERISVDHVPLSAVETLTSIDTAPTKQPTMAKKRRGAVGRPRKTNQDQRKTGGRSSSTSSMPKRTVGSDNKRSQSRRTTAAKLSAINSTMIPKSDNVVLPIVVQMSDEAVVTSTTNVTSSTAKPGGSHVAATDKTNSVNHQPPIARHTSQLLRNMLLSTDRLRAKSSTAPTSMGFSTNVSVTPPSTTPLNNPPYYYDYYQQYDNGPLNLEVTSSRKTPAKGKCWSSRRSTSTSEPSSRSSASLSTDGYYAPADLHAFPDIPQLADVDVAASLRGERDCMGKDLIGVDNDDSTVSQILCVEDNDVESSVTEDTLSNQSATDSEHRDFDQKWATLMSSSANRAVFDENSGCCGSGGSSGAVDATMTVPSSCCGDATTFDGDDRLVVDESLLLNNDLMQIQNYIGDSADAVADDAIMPLPDTSDVIRTLQYYESRLLAADHHLHSINGGSVVSFDNSGSQMHHHHHHHQTLSEFATMLPCPVAGCLWYSHSATLYVHLFTCHQDMISYGSMITHAFRRQDVRDYCFFTHLQYVQNTVYIVTVAYDCYSRTFVATIQHVSSHGDNTSVSSTTATLTAGGLSRSSTPPQAASSIGFNGRHHHYQQEQQSHSWTGHVQPYTVPLDVLHADGRCLFIDPAAPSAVADHVIVGVHLSAPAMQFDNDAANTSSMLACL